MAAIATLGYDDTLFTLRVEWLYTYARLIKSPHAKPFAPEFQTVGALIDAAVKTQGTLDDAAVMAAAARDAADEALDPVIVQILASILLVTKGDRADPLYVSYAGDSTAAQLIKPTLGAELTLATEWLAPLQSETEPALQAYSAPLAAAVADGAAAEKDVKDADKALTDFRLLGERKKAVDALNSARAILLGKLLQLRHDHPELRLGSAWATSFFRRVVKAHKFGNTIAQVEQYIKALDADRAEALAHLKELQDKAEAYEQAKADREKARADLAELKKAKKEQKAKEKALEAEANKKLPK